MQAERSPRLILRHLVDSGILEDDKTEEILGILSPDVASTIAVSAISCFAPSGELPNLDSREKFEWILQVAAYCLTLPTFFHDSLLNSLSVFRFWMKNNLVGSDSATRNAYARRMLRYLSSVFEYDKDRSGVDEHRVRLMMRLMEDLDDFAKTCGDWYESEAYNVMIRMVLGTANYWVTPKSLDAFPEGYLNQVLRRLYVVIFNALCESKLTDEAIWGMFAEFSKVWCKRLPYVIGWREKLREIFGVVCAGSAADLVGFQLKQFIRAVDLEVVVGDKVLFEQLSLLISELAQQCKNYCVSRKTLFHSMYPISIFFQLFGRWIFDSFKNSERNDVHGAIMVTLFEMCDDMCFPKNSPWVPVVLRLVLNVLEAPVASVATAVLSSGSHLLNRFYNDELCNKFVAIASRFHENPQKVPDVEFWKKYAVLLSVLSERKVIDHKILSSFLSLSTNLNASMEVLLILLRQSPAAFCEAVKPLYESDAPIISTLNCIIASYLPFVDFGDMNGLFAVILEAASRNREVFRTLHSFLILLVQYLRYSDKVYEMTEPILEFLVGIFYQQDPNLNHMFAIARHLCGRPFSRTKRESKVKLAFMVVDESLVTVLEDGTVEVRDSRGKYAWKLQEVIGEDTISLESRKIGDLGAPPAVESKPVQASYQSPLESARKIKEDLASLVNVDPDFQKPAEYDQMDYLKRFKDQVYERENIVNFIVESGLYPQVRQIEGSVDDWVNQFDSIADIAVVDVPVIHMNGEGITSEESEYFTYFKSILKSTHHLGMIGLHFMESEKMEEYDAVVVFNETPFELNTEHENAPKANIMFVVQPFDAERFKIQCICFDHRLKYWNALEVRRLIHITQLLPTICSALFRYFELRNEELFFARDKEREAFLKTIKTRELSLLETVEQSTFAVNR